MTQKNPLLTHVFRILASQGWVPVLEESPNLFYKRDGDISAGLLNVTNDAVETFGCVPIVRTPHTKFIADNACHLF